MNNLQEQIEIQDDCLCCPRCGDFHIHQVGVDIFDREEDEPRGTLTEVRKEQICSYVKHDLSGNPSKRRDGIVIRFVCEQCPDEVFLLAFSHDRGKTLVFWCEEEL